MTKKTAAFSRAGFCTAGCVWVAYLVLQPQNPAAMLRLMSVAFAILYQV